MSKLNKPKPMTILLWLLLLLLIICTVLHTNKLVKIDTKQSSPIVMESYIPKKTIDFILEKKKHKFELSGHFSNESNIEKIKSVLAMQETIHHEIIDESRESNMKAILLTQALIPIFSEKYSEGSIVYKDNKFTVNGLVQKQADKDTISTLLANSKISSKNNTIVHFIPNEPMMFKIDKRDKLFALQGEFLNELNAQLLIETIQSDTLRKRIKINPQLISNNTLLSKTAEVIKLFKKSYENGFIKYENKLFTVKGTVSNNDDKIAMERLLKSLNIPYEHHSEIIMIQVLKEVILAPINKFQEKMEKIEKEIQNIITFEHINFEVNKAILKEESMQTIRKISEILNAYPHTHVDIEGHTDDSGDKVYNLKLSQERVDSVKRALIGLGIVSKRMRAIGYGESKPLVSNDTKENRHVNRRVEFKIKGE